MRREIVLPAALAALFCALLAGAAWFVAAPRPAAWLLPDGARVLRVEQVGLGRQRITVLMGERQNRYDIYEHLSGAGWRLRRVNMIRGESDQIYFRRSLGDNMLEVAQVQQVDDDRRTLMLLYQRCFRQITCGIR